MSKTMKVAAIEIKDDVADGHKMYADTKWYGDDVIRFCPCCGVAKLVKQACTTVQP